MAAKTQAEKSEAELLQQKLFGCLSGAMTSSLIALGDTLGLFKRLRVLGKASSAQLAEVCKLDERFCREWCYQQVCSRQTKYFFWLASGRFSVAPCVTAAASERTRRLSPLPCRRAPARCRPTRTPVPSG